MVDVIERGEVAVMMSHWTGIYWNGQELGFKVFQEVVRRLHARFDNLVWMKLSEIARYSAARTLTRIDPTGGRVELRAPVCLPCVHLQSAARQRDASCRRATSRHGADSPRSRRRHWSPGGSMSHQTPCDRRCRSDTCCNAPHRLVFALPSLRRHERVTL